MISILCERGTIATGRKLARLLRADSMLAVSAEVTSGVSGTWDHPIEWDDVLLVIYRKGQLSPEAQSSIEAFRKAHPSTDPADGAQEPGGAIIPVALDPTVRQPPPPIANLKAAAYDGTGKAASDLINTVAVFLGLALRPGEHWIFISYRASDGKEIALDLERRLAAAGFYPWLDEAPDNVPPGQALERKLRDQISKAAMVLVLDTPAAVESAWIAQEIQFANEELIPILPIVVGPFQSQARTARVTLLKLLERSCVLSSRPAGTRGLSEPDWESVRGQVEDMLLAAYRRRKLLPFRAERAFVGGGFDWSSVDRRRRIYKAKRGARPDPVTTVLSHCFVHDAKDVPALRAYGQYVSTFQGIANINHKLCVYDREQPLSRTELAAIDGEIDEPVFVLAHHNELGLLIRSDFRRLR